MALTPSQFKIDYENFARVDNSAIQRFITAFSCLYQGNYGDCADYLCGLYVAHRVLVADRDGSARGALAGKGEGDTSTSYTNATPGAGDGDYLSTAYGLEFWQLMQFMGMGGRMAQPMVGDPNLDAVR